MTQPNTPLESTTNPEESVANPLYPDMPDVPASTFEVEPLPTAEEVLNTSPSETGDTTAPEPDEDDEVEEVSSASEDEESRARFYDNKTVELTKEIFSDASKKANFNPALALLRTTLDDWEARNGGNVGEIDPENADQIEWWLTMSSALNTLFPGKGLIEAVTRPDSKWRQFIMGQTTEVRPRETLFPRAKAGSGGKIGGNEAVELFLSGTKIGRPIQVPLWRSGIWVTIRPPSVGYLAEIDRALAFERPQLGLDTQGMLNSNEALIFEEILVDAALRLVTSSTYPIAQSPLELKEVISFKDIPDLIWGMAQAAFPEGVDIAIPCTSETCRAIDRVNANLIRMSVVDESFLTREQISFMDQKGTRMTTPEEVEQYQQVFLSREEEYFDYNGRKFNFYAPTIAQYFSSGRKWINSINRALAEAMGEAVDDDSKRARLIESMVTSEQLCHYAHYVRDIRIPHEDREGTMHIRVIDDDDTIRNILKMISADPAVANEFIMAVDKYINNTTISIIGYPNIPCTKCGKLHLNKEGEARLIIPFNASLGFFTLAQHKMQIAEIPLSTNLSMLGIRSFVQQVSANAALASSNQ